MKMVDLILILQYCCWQFNDIKGLRKNYSNAETHEIVSWT